MTRYTSPRLDVLPFAPARCGAVLDVGCGGGGFGEPLRRQARVDTLWGIDPEADRYEDAAAYDRVIHGSFPDDLPGDSRFDTIFFIDVLEHLVDPWAALVAARCLLTPDGLIVASIPNIRNWTVLRALIIGGEWRYREEGLLDRTHLRFFTRRSMLHMFHEAGLKVRTIQPVDRTKGRVEVLNRLSRNHLDEFVATQYGIVAAVQP